MSNPLADWVIDLSNALGIDPEALDVASRDVVLDLARDAAHAVARPAAPLTTFLVGLAAGQRGADASDVAAAVAAARELIATREPTNPR
jgi:uncharacterized protein DUF6457